MKKILTAAAFILASFAASSQKYMDSHNPREIKSLLKKENDLNGFGGVDLKVTDVAQQRTLLVGGYGSLLINRSYMLGLAGYGLATNVEIDGTLPDGSSKPLTITGGYAGVLLGGTLFPKEVIHLSFPLILAAGAIQISDQDFFGLTRNDAEFMIESSTFFVLEPAVEVEVNVTGLIRLAAGASYRAVRSLELENLTDEELSNWTAMLSVRIGRF